MLEIYNSLTRLKETFKPLHEGHVGMYVCGPTVYGDAHLGHARPAITFDVLYRYLMHLGYKVRYVRNITDVGHLEHDADEGEDKIAKKARLEQLEPMEVVQYYTNRYHRDMAALNVLPPSIEPHASGHIIEQIAFVQKILDKGYAYVSNGSVYMDVEKYAKDYPYGKLSGRNLNDIVTETRELDGQSEKKHSYDFALWKKASPEHIMHWPSPWSEGFPGWHMECSTMGTKYLGEKFDIHGGGLDLIFPHHEAEIAQSCAALGHESVHYWMHNNMITIAGKKMGKSYNNFITLEQFFSGKHELLSKPFGPMVIRFFILQAHYRSTLDFSNEALDASEKGYRKVMQGYRDLAALASAAGVVSSVKGVDGNPADRLEYGEFVADIAPDAVPEGTSPEVKAVFDGVYEALCDDINTPIALAKIFEGVRLVNLAKEGSRPLSDVDLTVLMRLFDDVLFGVLGLRDNAAAGASDKSEKTVAGLMEMVLEDRAAAKAAKDWPRSDAIRDHLKALGIVVKDTKNGPEWTIE